jgi:guanine deaminase
VAKGRRKAFRASLLHCLTDPGDQLHSDAAEYFEDGILIVEDGRVSGIGPAEKLLPGLSADIELVDYAGKLIVPGFVDTHVHYPQTEMIAAYGSKLLDWLECHAYPTERAFSSPEHAADVANFFVKELLRNGTTTALVFATVHPTSVDAIFEAALRENMRLLSGKVLMDRNCPADLRDDPLTAYNDSKSLLQRWHGKGRLGYAITPRFAATSSDDQLAAAGRLASEYPDAYVHTHLAENRDEVELVGRLFPHSKSYLDVYEQHGLVRERSVFAHCLHLDVADRQSMAKRGAAMAFCPSSNLFLGSGLFNLELAEQYKVRVGLGTDVGAGTSFGMLNTMSEAYKVLHLEHQPMAPLKALYMATLGGARALYLDDQIGNFVAGKEADFVVLDCKATPLIERRMKTTTDIADAFFVLMMLGDDRSISETYLMGELAHVANRG